MGDKLLVLISWLIGLGILAAVVGAVVLGAMAATGDFGKAGECISEAAAAAGGAPRGVSVDAGVADSWDAKWDGFDNQLDGGQASSVTFTESEVTSRAIDFFEDKNAPLEEITICFHEGQAEARAKVELPAISDVPLIGNAFKTKVKMTGTVDLSGPHPVIVINDLEAGNLPGFATDQVESSVDDIINERLDDLNLSHQYDAVNFTDGSAEVSGRP